MANSADRLVFPVPDDKIIIDKVRGEAGLLFGLAKMQMSLCSSDD